MAIQQNQKRIRTTHIGSLPRPHAVLDLLKPKLNGQPYDEKVLDAMEGKLYASLAEILSPMKLTYKEARIWHSPAVKFAPELIDCVRIGTEKAGFKSRDMISGAGHDAAYVARVAPTTMIFVPCAGGISHNEAESTSFDECAAGAQVLLNAVLEFDRRLA